MHNAKTRNEIRLKVEITTKPATAANRRALDRFWKRLLIERVVSVTNKDNGGEGSQTVRL